MYEKSHPQTSLQQEVAPETSGTFFVVAPEEFNELADLAAQMQPPLGDKVFQNGLVGEFDAAVRVPVRCECRSMSCWLEVDLPEGRTKFISANPLEVSLVRFRHHLAGVTNP